MDFQVVARLHHIRAPQEKNENFATKVRYPVLQSGCIPTGSNFPERPMLTGYLLQRKRDRTDVWMLVCLSLTPSGEIETDK